jgi:hypothetical protein
VNVRRGTGERGYVALQAEIDRQNRVIAALKRDAAVGQQEREARERGYGSHRHMTDAVLWGQPSDVLAGLSCPHCRKDLWDTPDRARRFAG